MYYLSEMAVQEAVTQDDVTEEIRRAFVSLASGDAIHFPVVRETLGYADAIFGFKSGFDRKVPALGVKAGGLWPLNHARGLANHQSTILLFDPGTGRPQALVCGTYLTALRTAAASALSIRALARNDAKAIGIVGAGGQGLFQARAALRERNFREIYVYDSFRANADALCAALQADGFDAQFAKPMELASHADVTITVTPSRKPILKSDWIRPGTHLACMGADTKGKQEVETNLTARAALFGDEPSQAITIGECQHAYNAGRINTEDIVTLGRVLSGDHPGRAGAEAITLFDGTGVALQDLAAAQVALRKTLEQGLAVRLEPEQDDVRSVGHENN